MNCSDYVGALTDHLDGSVIEGDVRGFEAHVESCPSCSRYLAVVEKGAEVLRALPEPELSEDFGPRLQHRLYHVDDEAALYGAASATPALTVVGMAFLFTAIAWSPTLWQRAPEIVLEPIVVNQPPVQLPVRPVSAMPRGASPRPGVDFERGLWEDQSLLYEYSPLSQRYRQRSRVRRAQIDQDR
ncbi:MAG: zf-HC2 domain-containing protein [Gemmatimonadetes bacterium]|mgnify:FL=1|jgi:anti-sigma factor RsiW|nr:zf-HC2 domain-containing protein [Gemmatimonadota bacterium]MEE2845815.1 zf-HC2 domain-containing protein [Gemmatimonadota bacterium]|tara:strand:- start:334 stop:888 length:555 start_codon:yes stop_codon:yes gene_type:complete